MNDVNQAIEQLRRGVDEEQSFRIIFDRYYGPVQGFFAKRVFSAEDRLDLTQETFLRIYKGIGGFRGDAQFGTWLFRIAHHTHLRWMQRSMRHQTVDLGEDDEDIVSEEPAVDPTPLDRVMSDERRLQIREAIRELPEQMRRCTQLRLEQDLSYKEIAATMRLSVQTVKVHLFQARRKLKGSLADIDF
jgi:RNA polymerase sigma-70 factor (ECF subfamily)